MLTFTSQNAGVTVEEEPEMSQLTGEAAERVRTELAAYTVSLAKMMIDYHGCYSHCHYTFLNEFCRYVAIFYRSYDYNKGC
jgi:hypothetical protein